MHSDPDILRVGHLLADAARAAILPHFRQADLIADNKFQSGYDPVTEADRAAERAMRDILARERPNDAILGEEYGIAEGTSGLTWVLDPIDGTRGFVSGTPTWGVLIAVSNADGPFFGIIDQPYIRERFVGHSGQAEVSGPSGVHCRRRPFSLLFQRSGRHPKGPPLPRWRDMRVWRALGWIAMLMLWWPRGRSIWSSKRACNPMIFKRQSPLSMPPVASLPTGMAAPPIMGDVPSRRPMPIFTPKL